MYHSLTTAGSAYDFAGLHAAVKTAITGRDRSVTVGLDAVDDLDAAVMRELIRDLRRMRETGGTLSLHVTRPAILEALKTAGLDKVFNLVVDLPQGPRGRLEQRPGLRAERTLPLPVEAALR